MLTIDPPAVEPQHTGVDPVRLCKTLWPEMDLYDKQREIMYSVFNNDETVVPAGNMLGKDFVAGLIALVFFLTRSPCRVVTTSVDQGQLEKVLWGEINRFIQTSKFKLPFLVRHTDIRKFVNGEVDPRSYLIGRVAAKEEGLLGHHLPRGPNNTPRTLMIFDESSGIPHGFKTKTDTWAHRTLCIGNPYRCENFFREAVREGVLLSPNPKRKYREVIKIQAVDSPNVKLGLRQEASGRTPTNDVLVPGVLTYDEYVKRRNTWDPVRQCVSLDADFYEGASVKLYPPEWLNRAEGIHTRLSGAKRFARSIGVDPAEGGDSTVWCVVDELGVLYLLSLKTPDTAIITGRTLALMREYNVDPENVMFDRGGGGKEHADRLRQQGYAVRTVGFGESVSPDPKYGTTTVRQARVLKEEMYACKNKRAEMYWRLRLRLSPLNPGFGLRREDTELRRQLAGMPLLYDNEGRMYMLPKHGKEVQREGEERDEETLTGLLGCSPDEADALVLAVYAMEVRSNKARVGTL